MLSLEAARNTKTLVKLTGIQGVAEHEKYILLRMWILQVTLCSVRTKHCKHVSTWIFMVVSWLHHPQGSQAEMPSTDFRGKQHACSSVANVFWGSGVTQLRWDGKIMHAFRARIVGIFCAKIVKIGSHCL